MNSDTPDSKPSEQPTSGMPARKAWSVPLGELYATRNAVEQIPHHIMLLAIARHCGGDWGDVCAEDWQANDEAMTTGCRLLSSYCTPEGVKFWIITEWDRSVTTVLLPDDY